MKIDEPFVRSLPKVLLHDHLDGGLRRQTVVELAKDQGYIVLPTTDASYLARWFHPGAQRVVIGFDLAGEEGGFPPKKHIDAFHYIQRENFNITVHAGEAFGKESIWQAIQWCGAHRVGHATRLIEDIGLDVHEPTNIVRMGDLAQYILDKRIPLEICLSSNVHTGAVESIESHPFGIYYRYKFRVTLNTDDRLMSDTTMT